MNGHAQQSKKRHTEERKNEILVHRPDVVGRIGSAQKSLIGRRQATDPRFEPTSKSCNARSTRLHFQNKRQFNILAPSGL